MSAPREFKRRVLVSVTGLSPQVVTETLYSLVTEQQFVPTEIILLTTVNGRNRAVRDLLDPVDGKFPAFCREYGLGGRIAFSAESIHVISDVQGRALKDIRTPEDNVCAADMISSVIGALCADSDAALHVSIAGGRKTMGFFLGYALSIFGREQDRLSHVLVSEPYENNRDFFYPTQTPREIYNADGSPLDAAKAKVSLAEIPFIRLRAGLSDRLLAGDCRYSEAVAKAQIELAPDTQLTLDVKNRLLICGNQRLRLPPLHFAVYLWLARRAAAAAAPVRPGVNAQASELLAVYRRIVGSGSADYQNACDALRHEDDFLPYFQEKRSRINETLARHLGSYKAQNYRIHSFGKRLQTSYGLALTGENIRIVDGLAD